ncbi:MAG: hypothetical protein Q8R82_07065 [Hyphomonadaceae bacterium]|nr:hypothetical protein [Hyphomonadaceae bacterium]
MKTSATRPPNHPNDWSLPDKNAFVALVTQTYARMARGENNVVAAHEAAREIGLESGERHWLTDEVLGGCFGVFYAPSSDLYANARDFVKWADARDLAHIGPDGVEWARVLADAETDH